MSVTKDIYDWSPAHNFPTGWNDKCKSLDDVFSDIYENKRWEVHQNYKVYERDDPEWAFENRKKRKLGSSGVGSNPKYSAWWIDFVQAEIDQLPADSKVLDVGCGDFEMMKFVDWTGKLYAGVEVARNQYERLALLHGSDNVRFIHGDATQIKLPEADLVIIKDVLQHLTNDLVRKMMLSQLEPNRHKRVLVCCQGRWWEDSPKNVNLSEVGLYREVDLNLPPYNMTCVKLSTGLCGYDQSSGEDHPSSVWEIKLTDW